MDKLKKIVSLLMPQGPMDHLAVGVIDFHQKNFQTFEATTRNGEVEFSSSKTYFDLASLTKPLTNSLSYFLSPESFDANMLLCLNHRGGLPSWGRLPHQGWEQMILGYPIKESETLYSDFSALRVMLELKKKGVDQKKICQEIWDKEMVYWTDLPVGATTAQNGFIQGEANFNQVHDPNAYCIHSFVSHAGLFSTVDGLCRTLLKYEEKTGVLSKTQSDLAKHTHRFSLGWDRVVNTNETLAGRGCGKFTFGHLGFTGTSIWIDPEKRLGHVILTNATKFHWYDKANLNDIRRALGEAVWKSG